MRLAPTPTAVCILILTFLCLALRDRLEASIRLQEQDMQKSRQALSTYEVLGEDFDRLVKEYTRLKQAVENKRWALQEFSRSDS